MLQTILSVAVVQLDIYSDKLLSFPHRLIAHIFALKKQDMSDFSFIPPTSVVTIPGTPRLRSLHLQDIRSLQGGERHRANHHQRQDEVHPVGRRQPDAVQYH